MEARKEALLAFGDHYLCIGTTTQNNARANALLALINSESSGSNIANRDNT
jgi:hypothetical protein